MGYGDIRVSMQVSNDSVLELTNGMRIRSIPELFQALKEMDEETFSHHVSKNNNDFSDWIYDNYGNEKIVRKVSAIDKKDKLEAYLEKVLKEDLKRFLRDKKEEDKKSKGLRKKRDVLEAIGNEW